MYYVYILLLSNKSLYVGRTDNLRRRITEHKNKKVFSTKTKQPLQLIYYEAYITKEDSVAREQFLKTGDGRKSTKRRLSYTLNLQ